MVVIKGNTKDGIYFSNPNFWIENKLWNKLTTHLDLVVKMFFFNMFHCFETMIAWNSLHP